MWSSCLASTHAFKPSSWTTPYPCMIPNAHAPCIITKNRASCGPYIALRILHFSIQAKMWAYPKMRSAQNRVERRPRKKGLRNLPLFYGFLCLWYFYSVNVLSIGLRNSFAQWWQSLGSEGSWVLVQEVITR